MSAELLTWMALISIDSIYFHQTSGVHWPVLVSFCYVNMTTASQFTGLFGLYSLICWSIFVASRVPGVKIPRLMGILCDRLRLLNSATKKAKKRSCLLRKRSFHTRFRVFRRNWNVLRPSNNLCSFRSTCSSNIRLIYVLG